CRSNPKEAIPEFKSDEERWYPARSSQAPQQLLDLSVYYNAPLFGNWSYDLPEPTPLPLLRGVSTYAGVQFDVRAIIQLDSNVNTTLRQGFAFPSTVTAIAVRSKASRIYFLHGHTFSSGPVNAKCIAHFSD